MAAVAYTPANIRPTNPGNSEIFDGVAGEVISPGQAIYFMTTGRCGVAAAGTAGKQQARGIALGPNGGSSGNIAIGQGFSYLKRGHMAGYTLTSMAYGALLYLSNTAGQLDTVVGTMTVRAGMVVPVSDSDANKLAYFDFDWTILWA